MRESPAISRVITCKGIAARRTANFGGSDRCRETHRTRAII